jgi:indole-3-glycerol phosphate synthase
MGILDEILAAKQRELPALRQLRLPAPPPRRPVQLARAAGTRLRLIAEIKRRSPSAGLLSSKLDIGARARAYERAGADMVSVLCDERFFDGSYQHLKLAREASNLPILCKEFVLDECQLDAARAFGADAVLLIVRCVPEQRVAPLLAAARARKLEALIEITSEREAAVALNAGATLLGVNARDLDSLRMDLDRARRVLEALPSNVVAVHLSGLTTPDSVREVATSRADAALIGEVLMRQDDPEPLLRDFVRSGQAPP